MRHLVLAMLVALMLSPGPAEASIDAPFAFVTDAATNSVLKVNLFATNETPATVPVGSFPFGVTVLPDGSWVYVTNFGNGSVSAIPVAGGTPTRIPVGTSLSRPMGIAATPDGSRVFVARSRNHSISVIDTTKDPSTGIPKNVVVGLPLAVGLFPRGVAVDPVDPVLYVTNMGSDDMTVVSTTTLQRVGDPIALGSDPYGVAVADDGKTVYVALEGDGMLAMVDMDTRAVNKITVGAMPAGVAIGRDGKVYVANQLSNSVSVYDPATGNVEATLDAGGIPVGVSASSDRSRIYVVNSAGKSLSVINSASDTIMGLIPLPAGGPIGFGIFVTPGAFAFNVGIDLKPGHNPNTINLGSRGVVQVAILSTSTFDAPSQVKAETVTLAGAPVQLKGNGLPVVTYADVNGDGLVDLVVHVQTEQMKLSPGATKAILEGETLEGTPIQGEDTVRIVPGK